MMLVELATFLQAQGHGTLGTDIFIGMMPDEPDAILALYEYSGHGPVDTMGGAPEFEGLSLQLRGRGAERDYQAVHTKMVSAAASLHAIVNEPVSAHEYLRVRQDNGPYLIAVDTGDRPVLASNFTVWRRK